MRNVNIHISLFIMHRLLVWKGDSKATHVYFDDIVNLIKEESIHSNVCHYKHN